MTYVPTYKILLYIWTLDVKFVPLYVPLNVDGRYFPSYVTHVPIFSLICDIYPYLQDVALHMDGC